MAATTQPPIESINVQYVVITDEQPQPQPPRPGQFGQPVPVYAGTVALTRQEVKQLKLTIGDEVTFTLTSVE